LIGSTKYDRNYDRSDFYPNDIQSNNSYESNNSNNYTNAVSDDDENDYPNDRNSDFYSDRYERESSDRSRHPSNGAIVRRRNPSNGPPEIHYHIYVSDKQAARWFGPPKLTEGKYSGAENEEQSKRRIPLWKKITLWAVITQLLVFLVGRYDLITLPPPPSYLTWEEYRSQQSRLVRKVSREGYFLLKHLARTASQEILKRGDLSNGNDDNDGVAVSPRFAFPDTWTSFLPQQRDEFNSGVGDQNSGNLNPQPVIFGQDAALEHLRKELNLWSSSQKKQRQQRNGHHRTHYSPYSQQQPLVVYVSGGSGVGKVSLAYLLLGQLEPNNPSAGPAVSVLEECAAAASVKATPDSDIPKETQSRQHYCPLLHLTPSHYHLHSPPHDYKFVDDDAPQTNNYDGSRIDFGGDSSLSPLYQLILDHVVAAGGGASIVVLDDMDVAIGCEHGGEFCKDSWLKDLMAEVRSQQAIFGTTIFMLTSQLGTTTVEKWTRKRLQSMKGAGESPAEAVAAAANAEVEALLRYELQRHYAATDGGEGENIGDTSMGIDDWLLLPLAPLDKTSMASILEKLASSGPNPPFFDGGRSENERQDRGKAIERSILLTEGASNRILDALEWHQWMHKSSGDILRIWSPDGALPLLELWEERVRKPIAEISGCQEQIKSARGTTALVLDFEGRSTDRLWLRLCEQKHGEDGEAFFASTDGRRWSCPNGSPSGRSCVFYL
jgi:hypothetical protein